MARKALTKKIRFEVFKRDKFTCQYCGRSAPDIILECDHIEPVSKGGTNEIINLITSCKDCNAGKRHRRLSDDTVLKKQKEQLDYLEESRQQRKMMLEWRKSLLENNNEELDDLCDYFLIATGFSIKKESNFYNTVFPAMIKKYGFNIMIDSIDAGVLTYVHNGTQQEVEKIIDKLGGIAYNINMSNNNPFYNDAKRTYYYFEKNIDLDKYSKYAFRKEHEDEIIDLLSFYLYHGVNRYLLGDVLTFNTDKRKEYGVLFLLGFMRPRDIEGIMMFVGNHLLKKYTKEEVSSFLELVDFACKNKGVGYKNDILGGKC